MKTAGVFLFVVLSASLLAATPIVNRPQKLAVVKAHSILPQSLKWIVRKHGKSLFQGLDQGMNVPRQRIDIALIQRESDKIPRMVDRQVPFAQVVYQMGYVSGLLAVYLDPSQDADPITQQGFSYYLNHKLGRYLFVFDGYEALIAHPDGLPGYVASINRSHADYRRVLEHQYRQVGNNPRYPFDERSAVFGVCSIYFSNLARVSAQLWRYSWSQARGDLEKTPFVARQTSPLARRRVR